MSLQGGARSNSAALSSLASRRPDSFQSYLVKARLMSAAAGSCLASCSRCSSSLSSARSDVASARSRRESSRSAARSIVRLAACARAWPSCAKCLERQPVEQRAELHRHVLAQPSQHGEAGIGALLGGRGLCCVLQRGGQPQLEAHERRSERVDLVRGRHDRGEELAPRRAGRLLRLDPEERVHPLILLQPLLVLLALLLAQRLGRHH
eukprot:scaffold91372_cov44-Phaeocystis_antarctica.AAC.1